MIKSPKTGGIKVILQLVPLSFKLASDVPSGWWPEGHSLHEEDLQSHIPSLESFKSGLTEPASCFPPGAGGWILPATWKSLVPSPLSLWLTPTQGASFLLQNFLSPPGLDLSPTVPTWPRAWLFCSKSQGSCQTLPLRVWFSMFQALKTWM